jgi:hypothetical protein
MKRFSANFLVLIQLLDYAPTGLVPVGAGFIPKLRASWPLGKTRKRGAQSAVIRRLRDWDHRWGVR